MKKLRLGILGAILTAVLVSPWLIQKRAEVLLVSKRSTLQHQGVLLEQLSSENELLSNNVAQVKSSHSLDHTELSELMKLRAERSEEHTSELQSHHDLVCRLLLEKKKKI